MTIEAIKDAIQELPKTDRLSLADWFDELENRTWDAEMERDFAPCGRGAWLIREAEADFRGGDVLSMEQTFADLKTKSSTSPRF